MEIYSSLFAYLNNSPLHSEANQLPVLKASQRPVIVLAPEENIENLLGKSWLIPIPIQDGKIAYEIGFPYLQTTDLKHCQANYSQLNCHLQTTFTVDISGTSYHLLVSDEVLDRATIKEESEFEQWQNLLQERLDESASKLMRLLIGMLTTIFTIQANRKGNNLLIELPEKLKSVNIADANLPIVLSLDYKYKLRRSLELISDKLRHQLRRQAELISVSKIQEMDNYCLRDYVRRPGLNPVEKAGSKQELMGIKRYQDFNTPENKFLVYFSKILHLNCIEYEKSGASQFLGEISKIRLAIDLFKQQTIVKTIQIHSYQFTKPNYVLQKNHIYRIFYEAYLEYLRRKSEKEKLWTFRNALLADSIYIYVAAALLQFKSIDINANLSVNGSLIPDRGCYINKEQNITVKIFLQNQVYVFSLRKPPKNIISDWLLKLEIHDLHSQKLEMKTLFVPIWVFWYRPNDDTIYQLNQEFKRLVNSENVKIGLLFYLQNAPTELLMTNNIKVFFNKKLWLVSLNDYITTSQGFTRVVNFLTLLIKTIVEFPE